MIRRLKMVDFIKVLAVEEFANSELGTVTKSGVGGDAKCDARARVSFGGVPYWIPLYNTAP